MGNEIKIKYKISDRSFTERASDQDLSHAESLLGISFPPNLKRILKYADGTRFQNDNFCFYEIKSNWVGCDSLVFLYFSSANIDSEDHIKEFYEKRYPEFFNENLVPFGVTGGGNYICFDYRKGKDQLDPPIVYWFHEYVDENDPNKAVIPIAPNFDAFMDMLMSDEEAEKEFKRLRALHPKTEF